MSSSTCGQIDARFSPPAAGPDGIGFAILLGLGLLSSLHPGRASRLAALARRLRDALGRGSGHHPADEQRWLPAWQALRSRLAALGLPLLPQHSPLSAARMCQQTWGAPGKNRDELQRLAARVAEELSALEHWRYGHADQRPALMTRVKRLGQSIDQLERLLKQPPIQR